MLLCATYVDNRSGSMLDGEAIDCIFSKVDNILDYNNQLLVRLSNYDLCDASLRN